MPEEEVETSEEDETKKQCVEGVFFQMLLPRVASRLPRFCPDINLILRGKHTVWLAHNGLVMVCIQNILLSR